jgi:hypothetical protein
MTKQIDDIRAEVENILDEYQAMHGRAATPQHQLPFQRDLWVLSLKAPWCLVCGLVTSSKLESGDLAESQMTSGHYHHTPTLYYG